MKLLKIALIGLAYTFSMAAIADENRDPNQPVELEVDGTETDDQVLEQVEKDDDLIVLDPIEGGRVDLPQKWQTRHVYLGATYYGGYGCRVIANYYGYKKVSMLGPYVVPGYWMPGYWTYNFYGYPVWVPAYWVPSYTVSYCYGVVKI